MTEQEYAEQIKVRAEKVKTKEDLSKLLDEITSYPHDYGTIVHGCFAAMIGAFHVVDETPQGGISVFQASCLGWKLVEIFMGICGAATILKYDDMLFPQYEEKFEKTITPEVWAKLQDDARKGLRSEAVKLTHLKVKEHWQSIVDGQVPFGYTVKDE